MKLLLTTRGFVYLLILFASITSAQNKGIKKFILSGYKVKDTLSGDLNLDGKKDMLLVLKAAAEDTTLFSENERPLLILLGQADGSYLLAGRNDKVVMCQGCGGVFGDPYTGMAIKDGYFSVEHYGGSNWRWTDIPTFLHDKKKKKWFLSRWGGESYHTSEPDKTTNWVKTPKQFGVISFENFKRD